MFLVQSYYHEYKHEHFCQLHIRRTGCITYFDPLDLYQAKHYWHCFLFSQETHITFSITSNRLPPLCIFLQIKYILIVLKEFYLIYKTVGFIFILHFLPFLKQRMTHISVVILANKGYGCNTVVTIHFYNQRGGDAQQYIRLPPLYVSLNEWFSGICTVRNTNIKR